MAVHGAKPDGDGKAKPAQQVHPQRAEAVVHGFLRAGIADQDEGDHAGDLPEEIDPDQVGGEHESEHRRHEDKQHRQEKRAAVRIFTVMLVIALHVAARVYGDQSADHGADDAHQQRERIDLRMGGFHQRDRLLHPQHQCGLGDGEQRDPFFPVDETLIDDEQHQRDLHRLHQMVEGGCPGIQVPCRLIVHQPHRDDGSRACQDQEDRDVDDQAANLFLFADQDQDGAEQRHQDQSGYQGHIHTFHSCNQYPKLIIALNERGFHSIFRLSGV